MKQHAEIKVHSSRPGSTYAIAITRNNASAELHCSCAAGENGQLCKHVLTALQGDGSILTEGQDEAWNIWRSILSGSELAVLFIDFSNESAALEKQIKALQRKAKAIKKEFARKALG